MFQVRLSDNGKHAVRRNHSFGTVQRMLQHRAGADKVDILLGKCPFPQGFNEGLEALALPTGQHETTNHAIIAVAVVVISRALMIESILLLQMRLRPVLPQSGEARFRSLFPSAPPQRRNRDARTIDPPSDSLLLFGRRIWPATFLGTFDSHLQSAANHRR